VDEVVPALRPGRLGAHDSLGEGAQLAGKVFLAQAFEGSGDDVADVDTWRQLCLHRKGAIGLAGEDLDLDAALGQALGDLDDVDVQAACIAGSWLLER